MWKIVLSELLYLVNILVAVILGFAIGFERKLRYKEAGVRTHTIVCVGSALMMVISKYAFAGMESDGARIAAQIVSGIGFLGAGIIMFRGQKMHGLTTAAGIWATAGVGMAAGAGMYIVATGATVIVIAIQCICHIKCRLFSTKLFYQIKIVFRNDDGESVKIKELFAVDRLKSLSIVRDGESRVFKATLNTDKEYSSQKLDEIKTENPFIISIERTDEE